jgi:hypothetical protein
MIFAADLSDCGVARHGCNYMKKLDLLDTNHYGRIESEVLGKRLNSAIQGSTFERRA